MNPAENLANRILQEAIDNNATDVHFYPYATHVEIFFRIQGIRVYHDKVILQLYEFLLVHYKFVTGMDIGESRRPQQGAIDYTHENELYSLRISILPLNSHESLAIRILPQSKSLPLEQLFLFPSQLIQLKSWMNHRAGLILFTGPTGSGKTTTLYALLEAMLAENAYQTITLEDPIEKKMENMLQMQVNEKAGMSYHVGLKAALRHDPDIIMVGEIRDAATAAFALEASLTGHLVLSTLHATNAHGTLARLIDMGIKPVELEQSLIAIAAIELIPIIVKEDMKRRAAIIETVDGSHLANILAGKRPTYRNFKHYRKKAYAYGYISKETLST